MGSPRTCLDCSVSNVRARGLCSACYGRRKRRGTLDVRPLLSLNRDASLTDSPMADGLTYRQMDYWVRQGYLRPIDPSPGSGSHRRWPEEERAVARRMIRLVDAGLVPAVAHRVARSGSGIAELAPGVRLELADA